MRKMRLLIAFIVLVVFLVISFYSSVSSPVKARPQSEAYIEIPLKFIPFLNVPTLEVEINDVKYNLDLDLGCSHYLCLFSDVLEKIKDLEAIAPIDSFDVKGNQYSLPGFRIPKISIQNKINIKGVIARVEDADFFLHGAQILPDIPFLHRLITAFYTRRVSGRIGWPLFKGLNCLLDFSNSVMFVGNDMKAIEEGAGYSIHTFAHMPFELNHAGIVLAIETDIGRKRFLIDTGSTWSLFNRAETSAQTFKTDKFQIGDIDFGKEKLRLHDFSPLIEVDGILGVDFLKKHTICLDFQNKTAYIRR